MGGIFEDDPAFLDSTVHLRAAGRLWRRRRSVHGGAPLKRDLSLRFAAICVITAWGQVRAQHSLSLH